VTPPALEIANLIRTAGAAFVKRNRQGNPIVGENSFAIYSTIR
jgi:hypothetical protein